MPKDLKVYEVDDVLEQVPFGKGERRFDCLGGSKNFQVFIGSNKMSRTEFLNKYKSQLDKCIIPVYEDEDITISQDSRFALPGFYIIATKKIQRTIVELDISTYMKCVFYQYSISEILEKEFGIKSHLYYEEHNKKSASTHFWVVPLYENLIQSNNFNASIDSVDIWKYLDAVRYKDVKDKIIKLNKFFSSRLKEIKYEL